MAVVSNKKIKTKSKGSRNPSSNKALNLEDLNESLESRRSAFAGSSSMNENNQV